jgi:hypothetical protein
MDGDGIEASIRSNLTRIQPTGGSIRDNLGFQDFFFCLFYLVSGIIAIFKRKLRTMRAGV